jgi:glycosyltransferase involved in cell wall biosynthesis
VNLLFVNYGDFTTNSLNHIAGFSRALTARGHACAVAVPRGKDTLRVISDPQFHAVTYEEALADPTVLFPDRRPADLLHAWTPREAVRKFVIAYQRHSPARLLVHLEDNEEFLIESYLGRSMTELRQMLDEELPADIPDALSHPLRYRTLLRLADGVTVIVDTLRRFVPPHVPVATLPPGVDFSLYQPQPANPVLRAELGLCANEKILVLTGSHSHANEPELRELYHAVYLLNQRGTPTRLVRTGPNSPEFVKALGTDINAFVLDLGFVEKTRLPKLLALADALVQPGRPGPFNDYRLPSKVPEFLAMGKPVVLPATNVGLTLRDGQDALLLHDGTAEEIANACARLFADPALSAQLGQNAAAFAHKHFDLAHNTSVLANFYTATLNHAASPLWLSAKNATDVSLLTEQLRHRLESLGQNFPDAIALADAATDLVLLCRQLEAAPPNIYRIKLEAERDQWKHEFDLGRQHAANLEAECNRLAGEVQRLALEGQQLAIELGKTRALGRTVTNDALREVIRLRDLVYQREEKIRGLQTSFSWQATAPLRALRRSLLDPHRPKQAVPPDPARFPPTYFNHSPRAFNPSLVNLQHSIDHPRSWGLVADRVQVLGWCFTTDDIALTAVRARIDERIVPGAYGLPRPDVAMQNAQLSQAKQCGFKIDLDFKPDDHEIIIEISDAFGRWHCIFSRNFSDSSPLNHPNNYTRWVRAFDTPTPEQLRALADGVTRLPRRPLISILLTVYNTAEKWLSRALASIQAQVYPHWELCVADDASIAPHIRPLLEKAAREDPRIKVVFRETNGHISAASNTALELATGEFTALFDHDDELAPHALLAVAQELAAHADAEIIYTDEDKIDEYGLRFDPHFKPDWNPDLFTSQNYLSHLTVYRTATLHAAGGFRTGLEGSQDWDLAMRVVEKISPGHIRHIPRVLYHWRAIAGSTALQPDEKKYYIDAAHRALAEHFTRSGQMVELIPIRNDHWRVKYPLPKQPPLVTLVIPTRNRHKLLETCVNSILQKTTYPCFELLIADNDSDDPATLAYFDELKKQPGRKIHILACPGPFNYSAINNRAVAQAQGNVIGLLNNDLEIIHGDWLDEMVSQALRPEIGCVGAKLYYPDHTVQHAGVITGLGGVAGHAFKGFPREDPGTPQCRPHVVHNVSAVTAACLVVRKKVFEEAGGFDANRLAIAFNDVDFCLKVEACGYRNLFTPFAELIHHESASRGLEDSPEKIRRFQSEIEFIKARWGERLLNDPAYNPNFSLDTEDFAFAYPPRVPSLVQG